MNHHRAPGSHVAQFLNDAQTYFEMSKHAGGKQRKPCYHEEAPTGQMLSSEMTYKRGKHRAVQLNALPNSCTLAIWSLLPKRFNRCFCRQCLRQLSFAGVRKIEASIVCINKTQSQMVCVPIKRRYLIKAGFSSLVIFVPVQHGDGAQRPEKCWHGDFNCT